MGHDAQNLRTSKVVAAMLVEWLGGLSPGILAQAVERRRMQGNLGPESEAVQ